MGVRCLTAEKSLLQRNRLPVPCRTAEQGILRSALELQRKWAPKPGGRGVNDRRFRKFPVIFPALRELRSVKGGRDARGPSPHRRSRAGALASTLSAKASSLPCTSFPSMKRRASGGEGW